MGSKDITERTLEAHNDVFADIVDALLFGGEQVITQDSLADAQPFSQYKADGGTPHAQERDVAKYWHDRTVRLSLVGLENQTEPEADMPLRVISYDGAAYRSQLLAGGRAERYPVVTLVLYFGTERRWRQPRSLKKRLTVDSRLDPFVSDYTINVFELAWLTDGEIGRFKSDFKEVALYLRAKRAGTDYRGTNQQLRHAEEILDLFALMSGNGIYKAIKPDILDLQKEKQGGITMCEVTQRLLDEGRIAGRTEGWIAGRTEGKTEGEISATEKITSLFTKLFALGRDEDVKRASADRAYLRKLMDEWQK